MRNIKVAYIGGGSKNWAPDYFGDYLLQDKIGGELRLYDINLEAAQTNKKYFDKLVGENADRIASLWECVVSEHIEDALIGADVVMISILPGSLLRMKVDIHYPEKYGIYQSVGDTVGPGGYSRALRTIPIFRFFAQKIRECCPDAWVVNYTNPMSMCINTLFREFPQIKAFGYCHEVFDSQKLYASIYQMYQSLSEAGRQAFLRGEIKTVKNELKSHHQTFEKLSAFRSIDRHQIEINVLGVNHFTFITQAFYQGVDLMPIVTAYIRLFRANNADRLGWFVPSLLKYWRNRNNVKFDLYETYHLIGAAGDRHLAEFLPERYLPLKHKDIQKNGFFLTPIWARLAFDRYRTQKIKKALSPHHKIVLKKSDEDGVSQIIPLMGGGELISNINRINEGQIPGLPRGTAVESNAKISLNRIEMIPAGSIASPEIQKFVSGHANNQKNFIEAYFQQDFHQLEQVFLNDPSVQRLSAESGRKLFAEMIDLNHECLEDWVVKGAVPRGK